jgi:hypothetical protein
MDGSSIEVPVAPLLRRYRLENRGGSFWCVVAGTDGKARQACGPRWKKVNKEPDWGRCVSAPRRNSVQRTIGTRKMAARLQ